MKIRAYLERNGGLSQELTKVAERIGVHPSTIYRWLEDEDEGRTPDINAENIAKLIEESDGVVGVADLLPLKKRRRAG